jgi:hypothetical protein
MRLAGIVDRFGGQFCVVQRDGGAGSGLGWLAEAGAAMRQRVLASLAALLLVLPAGAHVGSPDIYLDGMAGPYQVSITVRPPVVIPGLAETNCAHRAMP